MRSYIFLFLLVFTLAPLTLQGQKSSRKITLSGRVADKDSQPVKGAVIFIDKVKTDVVTDDQGKYRIRVSPAASEILVFSLFSGVSSQNIDGRTVIDFILTGETRDVPGNDSGNKDAMAAGDRNREKDKEEGRLVFDPKDARHSSYQSIYDMIRGRFPGVEVSGNNIRIMGSSSFHVSTEPLFVVDGVIVNSIDNISPQTVRSIEVLKGPDATVYGTRGSNGVIVITRISGKD
ncbi:MAG TPA: TonB-dependent receptor plug domain-containing protein [Bacteroidales bacterium]|jgi:TonB-dependent SusC/RagA subfamily outer membrane receptor|nr:TonB-dependent receptor plug domain-containing protein [Bacteroidales bacterium]HOS72762.1 TonB-dependent receptor plug domain-containing protein [Bacteroidales bacterium]HQH22707.1 TonB-dependent receptor plug domain-containing protein [Bacteroidales bacterium]HQJ82091.1 TonB-dependent receptor plug domain-containing protein [Bacteroidales bacterium]